MFFLESFQSNSVIPADVSTCIWQQSEITADVTSHRQVSPISLNYLNKNIIR